MDRNQLGPFLLLDKLGEGGMGVVYKARDTRLERLVAIKLLPESRVADPDRRARFMQEARAASALNHPNIVTIYDIAEDHGRHYIVMEFVDGKPLHEVIPRKGMRIIEALRIGAQIADALTAAHAAGIVHRDLKPGNIMVDAAGRAKVLDFGLAKLTAPVVPSAAADETRTLQPQTEEGAIMGSVPYMSPEQAEGRPVDERSDIFSFGAVLYEMVTGRRAFHGESRASTLAAVVERDPPVPSEVAPGVPAELERVIARCLRKDVARRSQHMSDVKLALDELRDESESGKLVRPLSAAAPRSSPGHRWLWPAVAAAFAVIAAGAVGWSILPHDSSVPAAQLVRVTPDDGYSYTWPTISPDGKFVAAISDRSGTPQLWLQQVGGGDPIQVTHSANSVQRAWFFPDGTHLLVWTRGSARGTIEIVPSLGGESRVLLSGTPFNPALSPDGRQVAYFENDGGQFRLVVIPTEGGTRRVIDKWDLTQARFKFQVCVWMPDGRTLAVVGSKRRDAPNMGEWEVFALPLDGGNPVPTGTGDQLRAAGFGIVNGIVTGNRLLISGGRNGRVNVWQTRFDPGSWRMAGTPRQLTFGTENEIAASVSTTGVVAIQSSKDFSDLYLLPLDFATGQASAPARRQTQDGREKHIWMIGGEPGTLYFSVPAWTAHGPGYAGFALDLVASRQRELNSRIDLMSNATVSPDGRRIAYSRPDGDISIGETGSPPETAGPVCKKCGRAVRFSPDGRYLVISPEPRPGQGRKVSNSLLELSSGRITPWLIDQTESVEIDSFFAGEWVVIRAGRPGAGPTVRYVAPWRPTSIPRSEWVEFPWLSANCHYSLTDPFIYCFQNSQLLAMRFDPKQRKFSQPFAVRMPLGSPVELQPADEWSVRGPGITFAHRQSRGSVWLMKLAE